jgi:asparagine synthase (glutamine-hydrolysing)
MCGIVAMFSRRDPVVPESLQRATKALHHRGPDGQRHWIAPHGHVGLGHARLSIIDLTTGDQPIASEDEGLRIVVNGEFYGYEAIRKELEKAGHRFRTHTDSEILVHLYEDLGPECLDRLRGEFAFVLWDEANGHIFAARDRFGIKPLFYTFHKEVLYIASEVKALCAAGVPARWDQESLYETVGLGSHPARTLFDGVFQIPPAHYMIARAGGIELSRYWDFDYPMAEGPAALRSDADYAEEFRLVLDEAVRIRLRADVPVGCYLSGGLDSSSVLGFAAQHRSDPIRAFTLTFDRFAYDEGAIAREMAEKAGAEFFPIPIGQDDLADHFADATAQSETLCFNGHGVAKFLLSRAAQSAGYKVVLTGEGADEVLGGYPHFRRDMLLYNPEGQDATLVASLVQELGRLDATSRQLLPPQQDQLDRVKRLLGYVPSWIEAFSGRSLKIKGVLASDFLERFSQGEGSHDFFTALDIPGQLSGRDPVNQSLYLFSRIVLPSYILPILGDRMEMAHSIEARLPFLDHKVVELLRSQPVALKVRGMSEKYILREAARSVITETTYERKKHAFMTPPATLDPNERLCALVQETLRGPVLASIPFFDRSKVIALLDRLDKMDMGARLVTDQVLMMLLSACVLQERFRLAA